VKILFLCSLSQHSH